MLIVLCKHQVPNFQVTVTIATRSTIWAAATMVRTLVIEDFRVRTTRTFPNFPEVIFQPRDMGCFYTTFFVPSIIGFLVIRIYCYIEFILVQFNHLSQEFPCPVNGIVLEVVTEGEITKHFKEGMVASCPTYIFKVTSTHTFLACSNSCARWNEFACKEWLERCHTSTN